MANVLVEESYLSGIASAIRGKNGLATTYTPSQMAGAISAIPTGGGDFSKIIDRTYSGTFSDSTITKVGSYAFYFCSKLTSVNLENATIGGFYGFANCTTLTAVSLPNVVTLSSSCFSGCVQLNNVYIPKVTTLYWCAFQGCSSITTLSFPSVTNIWSSAFRSCYRLISLYLMGPTVCKLSGTNAFTSTPISTYSAQAGQYGSIYVPSSLYATYIASTNWVSYSSRFVSI